MLLLQSSPTKGYAFIIGFIVFVAIFTPLVARLIMRQVRSTRAEAGIVETEGTGSNLRIIQILVLAGSAVIVMLLFMGVAFFVNMVLTRMG